MLAYVNPDLSAEMLGAYLERNLPEIEMKHIYDLISNDEELGNLVNDIIEIDTDWNANIYEDNPDFDLVFSVPEIMSIDEGTSNIETDDLDDNYFLSDENVYENQDINEPEEIDDCIDSEYHLDSCDTMDNDLITNEEDIEGFPINTTC